MTLEAKNLTCSRGGKYLFRNLSFCLQKGQLLLIRGPNGSGKTTLLKILAGLLLPDKGSLHWEETGLSYVGHKEGVKGTLTPYENIMNAMALVASNCTSQHAMEVLSIFGLSDVSDKACQWLSAGQRKKVALASIVLKKNPLWILDEPFTALDEASCRILKNFFIQYLKQGGMIVMASHIGMEETPYQVIDLSL